MVNKLYLRNEEEEGLAAERLYLVRLSASHLYELRKTIELALGDAAVRDFVDRLPDEVRADLSLVRRFKIGWIQKAVGHIRNNTFHYGNRKKDLDNLRWALTVTAEDEGEVTMIDDTLGGQRLGFADTVANQQLARRFPEYEKNPKADIDDSVLMARSSELFKAMSDATTAALRFLAAVVHLYLSDLPDGVVVTNVET